MISADGVMPRLGSGYGEVGKRRESWVIMTYVVVLKKEKTNESLERVREERER